MAVLSGLGVCFLAVERLYQQFDEAFRVLEREKGSGKAPVKTGME